MRSFVLQKFLKRYGSDVINMISMEFNLQDAQRAWKKDGILIGTIEKAEKVAAKLLKRGMSIEDVAEDTELSIEEVKKIAKKIEQNK